MAASLRNSLTCVVRVGWTFTRRILSTPPQKSACAVKDASGAVTCGQVILPRVFNRNIWSFHSSTQNAGITALVKNMNRLSLQSTTPLVQQVRTKVRYSRGKGKPKAVKSVPARFYRLNWGIWIRTKAGRGKRLWTKTSARKYRLRQHVFCNRTQSKLLDRMVTRFWRAPKHWVDDPYEPYHKRENFDMYFPQKRPFYP